MKNIRWTKEFCEEIHSLIKSGLTYPEISKVKGIKKSSLSRMIKFGYKNPNYIIKKTKAVHLIKDIFLYFKTHSFEETMDKFNLTRSELKSHFKIGYGLQELEHIRKYKRKRDMWTGDEIRTMLRWCGILSREEIANLINRGHSRVIKEKLSHLGVSSRNINGMNISQFRMTFGDIPVRSVITRSGAGNNFTQVLWIDLFDMIKKNEVHASTVQRKIIEIMAIFQKWLWGEADIHKEIFQMLSIPPSFSSKTARYR